MRSKELLKRLPLLVIVAVGLWLWKGNLFPQERELVWALDAADRASLREVEIQLWDAKGELLKREVFYFQSTRPGPDLVQRIPLRQGRYTARLFLLREGGGQAEPRSQSIDIGPAETYPLRLSGDGQAPQAPR